MDRGKAWRVPTQGGLVTLALLLGLAAACSHPWDDYEAPEHGAAGGGTPSAECQTICGAYELCAGQDWSACESQCAGCSVGELQTVAACVDTLSDECPGVLIAFRACVNTGTECMEVP